MDYETQHNWVTERGQHVYARQNTSLLRHWRAVALLLNFYEDKFFLVSISTFNTTKGQKTISQVFALAVVWRKLLVHLHRVVCETYWVGVSV